MDISYFPSDNPEELAEFEKLAKIGTYLNSLEVFEPPEHFLHFLDQVYKQLIANLWSFNVDREDLLVLQSHLYEVAHDSRKTKLNCGGVAYYDKWRIYAELVGDQYVQLNPDGLEKLLGRDHVSEIVKIIRLHGPVPQKKLKIHYPGIGSAPNITRVVNEMEAGGLLIKTKKGSGNLLGKGPRFQLALEKLSAQRAPAKSEKGSNLINFPTGRMIDRVQANRVSDLEVAER